MIGAPAWCSGPLCERGIDLVLVIASPSHLRKKCPITNLSSISYSMQPESIYPAEPDLASRYLH
jgi:hypothetical protein